MSYPRYYPTARTPMASVAQDDPLFRAECTWLTCQMAKAEARGCDRLRVNVSSVRLLFGKQLATRPWLANRLNRAETNDRTTIVLSVRTLRTLLDEQLGGLEVHRPDRPNAA